MNEPGTQHCSRCGEVRLGQGRRGWCDRCGVTMAELAGESLASDVPADFYQRHEVVSAVRSYDFGGLFRLLRRDLGLSQEALGLLIGLDQSRVCKIEGGGQRLRDVAAVARLARVFGVPGGLLGFGHGAGNLEGDATSRAVSWLERRDFLTVVAGVAFGTSAAAGPVNRLDELVPTAVATPLAHVGASDVERIEAATAAFRAWDNQWGGGVSRAAVTAQLQWVAATAREAEGACGSGALKRRLLTATADLAALVAFISYDVEDHETARRLWLVALDAAQRAGNPDLMSYVLRQLAHQALHLGRSEEALRLVQLAANTLVTVTSHETPGSTLAELATYESWAHAMTGRVQPALRALGKAEDAFDEATTSSAAPWMAHFDTTELAALRGHCLHVLAEHRPEMAAQAEPLLRAAVEGRGPEFARRKTLNQIALASTFFQRGDDLEEGAVVGREAVAGANTLSSPRSLSRLRGLEVLTRPYAAEPVVTELRRRLRPVLARAVEFA